MVDQSRSYRRLAKRIRKENDDLEAPLNDIESCIMDVVDTGVDESGARDMVPKMIKSSDLRDENGDRRPNKNEILLYELPDKLEDLYLNPE